MDGLGGLETLQAVRGGAVMTAATIHTIKTAVPKGTAPRKQRKAKAALLRRHAPAIGLGAVIMVLLSLSLSHLARGIEIVTSCQSWEGWAMAIGLDLLIVA